MTEAAAPLPTIDFCGHQVSRLICGGNPMAGFSHVSPELDSEMVTWYTMPRVQQLFDACAAHGINTVQTRGDRFQMRGYLEHRLAGGRLKWIAQTASEFKSFKANVDEICRYEPIAIYVHGTNTDNAWHEGRMAEILDVVRCIKDHGLPAGVGTHVPEVIEYCEAEGWPTDFYMACFYNLARGYKAAPAEAKDAYARDRFPPEDPPRMGETIRATPKPCLAFKLLAASRNATTPEATRAAFECAFAHIKPTDAVVVGMFQKHTNQVAENAATVREILACGRSG